MNARDAMDRNARQSTDREPSFRREQLVAEAPDGYWTLAPDALFERFKSGPSGIMGYLVNW